MFKDVLNSVFGGIMAFVILLTLTRILGRKAISQMSFFDFAVSITMGTLAAHIGAGSAPTAPRALMTLVTIIGLGILVGYLQTKSILIRKIVNSEPVVVIENGEIIKDNMKKARLSIGGLTSLLREKNAFNIADVEFAILEIDGILSVEPKSQKQPVTPSDLNIPTQYKGLTKELVIDGHILHENLEGVKLDEAWLKDRLREKGIDMVEDVFFAALDSMGGLYVSRGIEGREKGGKHGIE